MSVGKTSTNLIKSQRGISIVENMLAIALLGIVIAGSSRMIIMGLESNGSTRNYAGVAADVQSIFDSYRNGSYLTLLNKFNTPYLQIGDGQSASENTNSSKAKATYQTTFTAIKASATSYPEAVKIAVQADQRRGKLGNVTYTFETVIAQRQ